MAIVLIIGAGFWYANSGPGSDRADEAKSGSAGADGGKDGGGKGAPGGGGKEKAPQDPAAKVGFQLPVPPVPDLTPVGGSWVTEQAYVKAGVDSVVAYQPDTGKELWKLPLPGAVCAASRHVQDGRTAIAYEATRRKGPNYYQPCTEIAGLDLATGKLLWTKSVTGGNAGDDKVKFSEVTVGGGTVAAGGTDGGAAWDLATGKELWKPEVNAESCYDNGYGGGAGLVAVRLCGSSDSRRVEIQNLDPKSGAPVSTYKMPAGVEYAGVVSTKPLVVAADVGDTAGDGSSISDFFSIDEATGKLKAKITADADMYAAECGSTEVEKCEKAVVGNNRLYVPTEEHEGESDTGRTNEVVSFDLATGKPTTDKAPAGEKYHLLPLRMDGGNLIAYKPPSYDGGGQVVSIDGATFQQTVLMKNPAEEPVRRAEGEFEFDYLEIRYADGRLFLSQDNVDKIDNPELDRKYLAMVLTTH
ncbi:PQQ-like beta-propeller repeat protein [Streptomyces solincola]|uniref:PQQ-like beta-propeller repeat protein n=1 Tax=Streptomyces solincola TaxID=2100817 RepID=UPI002159A33E|nr:PQQ-like beta-propeller repeat protein [Streptomyces solincola]